MNTFNPTEKISSTKLNENFSAVIDGTGINDDVITSTKLSAQESWTEVTYKNSWVAYDSSTYYGFYYMKDHMGFVHFRGLVKDGSSRTAVIATMPVGYRPAKIQGAVVTSNNVLTDIEIRTNGDVIITGAGGSTAYVSLCGVRYKTT